MTTTSSAMARRRCLQAAVALAAGLACLGASAQSGGKDYPNKPIKIVVAYAPGGLADAMARALADKLSKSMGVPVVVDNKPGAAGIIGTDFVAKAAPDGYTITLALSNAVYANQFIYPKLPYNPNKDLSYIYKLASGPSLLVVNSSVPAKNLAEFQAWLKANSGKVNYASYGVGSQPHMLGEYIAKKNNIDASHAVYKGEAPIAQDLLSGQVHFTFGSPAVMKPHFEGGKLRPIAVIGSKRFAALPDLPTFGEQGWKDAPYSLLGWFGFLGPAGMPKPIQDKLAEETRKAMQDPDLKARFLNFGYEAVTDSSPDKLLAKYKQNVGHWKELVQISGAKLD